MKTYIIAEAGVNHNGDIRMAKELIDTAFACGADAVKFQTFISENLVTEDAPQAEYQKRESIAQGQLQMLKQLELSFDQFTELKDYCTLKNIDFLTTAFDMESLDFVINTLRVNKLKIPSGEITNLPYLEKCSKSGLAVIISTGMSTIDEIQDSLAVLRQNGNKDITLLHCSTEYPATKSEVNLAAMVNMRQLLGCKTGYSDHTEGVEISYAAVALGACIIEKHFTLSKKLSGPDHLASIEPNELKELVAGIRNIEKALGDGKKNVTEAERKNLLHVRKSIVAKNNIKRGEVFSDANLTVKRPATGISPMRWYDVLGKQAQRDFCKDEIIEI